MKHLCILSFFLLIGQLLLGQENEYASIVSDRPGQTFSANVLEKGVLQAQLGYSFFNKSIFFGSHPAGGKLKNSLVDLNLRFGLSNRIELNFYTGMSYETEIFQARPSSRRKPSVEYDSYPLNPSLGVRYQFSNNFSLHYTKTLDTQNQWGADVIDVKNGHLLRASFTFPVGENGDISSNLNAAMGKDDFLLGYTFNYSHSFGKLSAFVELFQPPMNAVGLFSITYNDLDYLSYDAGLAYQIRDIVLLDCSVGTIREGRYSKQFFLSVGATVNIPNK